MDSNQRIALPILLIQTISVVFLWSLDALGQVSQKIFTLFLATDLLSFALMAHVYRKEKEGSPLSRGVLIFWGIACVFFLAAGLFVS